MGEWSEYFEDFPEQDPSNYVGNEFNPSLAKSQRDAQQKASEVLRRDQKSLDDEIAAIVQKHRKTEK